jgi:hypothetical protein
MPSKGGTVSPVDETAAVYDNGKSATWRQGDPGTMQYRLSGYSRGWKREYGSSYLHPNKRPSEHASHLQRLLHLQSAMLHRVSAESPRQRGRVQRLAVEQLEASGWGRDSSWRSPHSVQPECRHSRATYGETGWAIWSAGGWLPGFLHR